MFPRNVLATLEEWADSSGRKPMILRGARQVGKTEVGRLFGKRFKRFIYIDLEEPGTGVLFRRGLKVRDLFQAILLKTGQPPTDGDTLLFLDEIQSCPEAVESLRYFYEKLPEIHVIAAGSLLEIALHEQNIAFPVGRVQHLFLYPLSFKEYLTALDSDRALAALETVPLPAFAEATLFEHFHRYTLVGGMPEVVATYLDKGDVAALGPVYESLLVSYVDDVGKYAENKTMATIMRHCIEAAPHVAGRRIKFEGFGNSNYRSREVGEALRTLQRAMLISLQYPSTSIEIPIVPDLKKSPRLQYLDTGLLNYSMGLQHHYFENDTLHSFFKGILAEQIVGQELRAIGSTTRKKQCFWVREKSQSQAEVDFVVQYRDCVIPIEVKSGKVGRLRSLHQFMNRCPHGYAIRLYAGPLEISHVKTPEGKPFHLLNLPYFLASKVQDYVAWMMEKIQESDRNGG